MDILAFFLAIMKISSSKPTMHKSLGCVFGIFPKSSRHERLINTCYHDNPPFAVYFVSGLRRAGRWGHVTPVVQNLVIAPLRRLRTPPTSCGTLCAGFEPQPAPHQLLSRQRKCLWHLSWPGNLIIGNDVCTPIFLLQLPLTNGRFLLHLGPSIIIL